MEGTARIWFTPQQRAELWERWKNGQCVAGIARALERRNKSGVYRRWHCSGAAPEIFGGVRHAAAGIAAKIDGQRDERFSQISRHRERDGDRFELQVMRRFVCVCTRAVPTITMAMPAR
jgi:hypothetical protein